MVDGELGMNVIVEPLGKVATSRVAPPAGPPTLVQSTWREIVVPSGEKVYVTLIVSLNAIFGKNGSGVGAGMGLAACVGSPAAALNVTEGFPVFR